MKLVNKVLTDSIPLVVIALVGLLLITLFTSCKKDDLQYNQPSEFQFTIIPRIHVQTRIITTLTESDRFGKKFSTQVKDTIITDSVTVSLTKPSGLYAYASIMAVPIGHSDRYILRIKAPGVHIEKIISLATDTASIPESFIKIRP